MKKMVWFGPAEVIFFFFLRHACKGSLYAVDFFYFLIFIYLFIFGCVGSSFLYEGFL